MTPLLLIPGLMATPALFDAQSRALWPLTSVMVANTTRGVTIGEVAEQILADAPARFTLAGLSMGGYVAFEILRRAPERVAKLALLNTSARPDTKQVRDTRRKTAELMLGQPPDATTDDFLNLFPVEGMIHVPNRPRVVPQAQAMARALGPDVFIQQSAAIMSRLDSRPDLSSIRVPTLVLTGENDGLTPPAIAQEMAEAIPNSRLVILPGCGHLSTLESPEAVTLSLRNLMESGDAAH